MHSAARTSRIQICLSASPNGWPLNAVNPATLYGGGDEGLTDYPAWPHAESLSVQADEV